MVFGPLAVTEVVFTLLFKDEGKLNSSNVSYGTRGSTSVVNRDWPPLSVPRIDRMVDLAKRQIVPLALPLKFVAVIFRPNRNSLFLVINQ